MSTYRISYRDRDGKKQQTARWHVDFRDHLDRRQRVPGFEDKHSTRALERKLLRLVALRATGATPDEEMRRWIEGLAPNLRDRLAAADLLTSTQVAALKPLSQLQGEWEMHLAAKGSTSAHVQLVTSRARKVVAGIGAEFWSALDASRVEQFLKDQRDRGMSTRTSNFHLQALRQFCRWAVRTGIASEDPLRILQPVDVRQTRERRALTAEQLALLLERTANGAARDGSTGAERADGIPGRERALLYRMAAETGLRRNELKTLHVADLDIADPERASVQVRATNAKNRKEARLPLRESLARELAAHVASRLPRARVFTLPKDFRAAAVLRADLTAAGLPYEDDAGRVVDFHSLRVTFATNLARGGVSLQLAQRLLRHSTPVLTSNTYTVLGRDDERRAVAALPDVTPAADPPSACATGTEGAGLSCGPACGAAVDSGGIRGIPGDADAPRRPAVRGCDDERKSLPRKGRRRLAGADRNRTDLSGVARHTGFEDRGAHQVPGCSRCSEPLF